MSGGFFVLCQGYCGSHFLANSLTLHPDIICTHGHDHPITTTPFPVENMKMFNLFVDKLLPHGSLNPVFFRNGINKDFSQAFLEYYHEVCWEPFKKYGPSFIHRWQPDRFLELEFTLPFLSLLGYDIRSIPEMKFDAEDMIHFGSVFTEMAENVLAYEYIGNVHGFNYDVFLQAKKLNPGWAESVSISNLVRHPIPRYASFINRVIHEYHFRSKFFAKELDSFLKNNKDETERVSRAYGVDFSLLENKIFFYDFKKLHVQQSWAKEFLDTQKQSLRTVYFESMVTDPDYFKSLAEFLTNGEIDISKNYLQNVFSKHNSFRGRQTSRGRVGVPSPNQVWDSFSPWVKSELIRAFGESNIVQAYADSPYSFDFMTLKSMKNKNKMNFGRSNCD